MSVEEAEVPTLKKVHIPLALVVGGTDVLIAAVGEAALGAQVLVVECTAADAPTTAAQMRPLVLVLPEDVYAADREGYDMLARDVRGRVLAVGAGAIDPAELEEELRELMLEAERDRPSFPG